MKNIEKLATSFVKYCQYEKNLSYKTIKSYSVDLKQFISFLASNNHSFDIMKIDKTTIRSYLESLSGLKPKSMKRKMATIKALFNYLEYDDQIVINPFRKIKIKIKEPFQLPNVMNIGEIEKILRAAYREVHANSNKKIRKDRWRDVAILELLFATGLRVSEVSGLKAHSVNLSTGLIKVRGKGNKERIITVCNKEILHALKAYIGSLYPRANSEEEYFFTNRLNKRLSEQSIRFLVKKYAHTAGFERNITPHVFRHTFATLLLEQDVDIKYIQHLLGHSSITTTQIYTHVNSQRQREILSQKHPRKQFVITEMPLIS